jgi:mycoredoxin
MSDATPDTPSALETPDLQDLPVPTPAAGSVTMFTTSWCGYCTRLKGQLTREGVQFTEINLETSPEHVDFVEQVNGGNRTVPTVVFPDGSAATNPSLAEVKQRLAG